MVLEIQNRLKQAGFKVLRWSSRVRVTEATEGDRLEQYNKAEASVLSLKVADKIGRRWPGLHRRVWSIGRV